MALTIELDRDNLIRVLHLGKIAKDVAHWVARLAIGLERVSPPAQRIDICLAPAPAVSCGDDPTSAFGFFAWPPDRRKGILQIGIAGQMPAAWCKETGAPRSEGITALLETICHEYAHYEQYRAGREPSERGVDVRARNLLRLALPTRKD